MPIIPKLKIGFTGTQVGLTGDQSSSLIKLLELMPIYSVAHGDCIGADEQFHVIALELKYKIIIHPPTNPSKRAFCLDGIVLLEEDYLVRNRNIVDTTDGMIACPKEKEEQLRSGTWATIRYTLKVGKCVQCIYPDGQIVIKT